MQVGKIKLNDKIVFGKKGSFVFIGGPCVIESRESALYHAKRLKDITEELGIGYVFKSSYDKANRSSIKSYRGPGIREGLDILREVKERFDLPVLTDIHSAKEAEISADVVDIIQVPAFLCRQTDIVCAAAETGKAVNIKKGQFLSPWEVKNIIDKVKACGNRKILITERGFSFGYNNLVNDFRAIPIIRGFGVPVVFDATHSVQMPGGLGSMSGGKREYVPVLSRCAIGAGADALFFEVHRNPANALCDGANSMYLKDVKKLLEQLLKIKRIVG